MDNRDWVGCFWSAAKAATRWRTSGDDGGRIFVSALKGAFDHHAEQGDTAAAEVARLLGEYLAYEPAPPTARGLEQLGGVVADSELGAGWVRWSRIGERCSSCRWDGRCGHTGCAAPDWKDWEEAEV